MKYISISIISVLFSISSAQANSVCVPVSHSCCHKDVKLSYITKCKINGGSNCESMGKRLYNDCMGNR